MSLLSTVCGAVRGARFCAVIVAAIGPAAAAGAPPVAQSPAAAQNPARESAPETDQVDFPIVIRVSEDLLSRLAAVEIDRKENVNVVVLGTRATGIARVQGGLALDLKPAARGVAVDVHFKGTCVSWTTGRNRSALIYTTATTRFAATKAVRVELNSGIAHGKVAIDAKTRVTTNGVGSTLRGLRGRIVRRVAWRRAQQAGPQVTVIARLNAEARLSRAFDAAAKQLLEQYDGDLDVLRPLVERYRSEDPDSSLVLSSTDDYLQVCLGRASAREPPKLPSTEFESSPIEVWLHRSMIGGGELPTGSQLAVISMVWGGLVKQYSSRRALAGLFAQNPVVLSAAGDWVVFGLSGKQDSPAESDKSPERLRAGPRRLSPSSNAIVR